MYLLTYDGEPLKSTLVLNVLNSITNKYKIANAPVIFH